MGWLLGRGPIDYMHKKMILLITAVLACFCATAQEQQPARYRDKIFDEVQADKNIRYAEPPASGIKRKYYLLDIYQPKNDPAKKRPLIIWMHGGGFKLGNKSSRGIPLWSKDFAQRGYVCAAINYRNSKGKTLSQFEATAAACHDAIEDLYRSISFLKQHADEYGIDTNRIILAGNSAGAMIALHAVYASAADLKKMGKLPVENASATINPLGIAAVINFWGALFSIDFLKQANVPVVSVHGFKDRVVPYTSKGGLHGSLSIKTAADALEIPNALKTYNGYGHELQKHFIPFFAGGPVKKRWKEAAEFAAEFLYRESF